jgi:integrase
MLAATHGLTERTILLALATSGPRRAEALGLDWHHVDLQGRQLHVRGKGDKDRPVVIFGDLPASRHALHAQQVFPREGPVFRGRQGRPLQKSTLQRWLNRWLDVAGLRTEGRNALTLHSLRRFAAKQWLDNGPSALSTVKACVAPSGLREGAWCGSGG